MGFDTPSGAHGTYDASQLPVMEFPAIFKKAIQHYRERGEIPGA
jgi:hypothetical protein